MSEHKTTAQQLVDVYKRVNTKSDFIAVVIHEAICFDPAKAGDDETISEQWDLIHIARSDAQRI